MPATDVPAVNTTSRPSTNESAAARTQTESGAAKGKRRRASSGSTMIAVAGTANQSAVRGADGESWRRATSSALASAATTISTSNP